MRLTMLVLLCLCLVFHTACANNNETDSELQNNCPNSTDTSTIEYNTTLAEDSTDSQLEKSDEKWSDFLSNETWYSYSIDGDEKEDSTDSQLEKSDEKWSDFLSNETWYSYSIDGDEKKVYTLLFYPSSNRMEWKIGYYESEWENTFVGSYSIDKDTVFHADLCDTLRDTEMQVSFTVNASRENAATVDSIDPDAEENSIILTITDASLDRYKKMVNESIYFTHDSNPDYPLETANFVIEQSIHSHNVLLYIVADRQMTLKENILYDGSDEEYFRFSVLNAEENDLASLVSEGTLYSEDISLCGETISGYSYQVYSVDTELRKGQIARCYKILISVSETDLILIDAYHYTFKEPLDVDDYWDRYIMPVIKSINIDFINSF